MQADNVMTSTTRGSSTFTADFRWQGGLRGTVNGILRAAVAKHPERVYLHFLTPESDQKFTYRDVDLRSNQLAHGLIALGVKPGDRVAMLFDSHVDAVTLWFAVSKCGGVFVPINTANKGEFLLNPLENCGAEVIVAESDYCERVRALETRLPAAKHVIYRGNRPIDLQRLTLHPLTDLYAPNQAPTGVDPVPEDYAGIIYTGGTTGPSKGCILSHNYFATLATRYQRMCAVSPGEVIWTPLPLFHLNALATSILFAPVAGVTVAVSPRFSVSNFWSDVERCGARSVAALGAMVPLIAQAPDTPEMLRCRGQVRLAMGAPFPEQLQKVWRERFGVQQAGANAYGLTEASYITNLACGERAPEGSSGKRNEEDFEVMIVGADMAAVADGEGTGEILVRPKRPHVMFEGYWGRPEETLRILGSLWLHTGDIGKFDRDGFFYFVDRKKDYLRRRGENISSYEMETTYLRHAAIEEVAVHAVPSKLTEDDVKITAVLRGGATLTALDLAKWSADNVPYYAMPRYIEFRTSLPKNSVGRVLKHELRDQGVTPSTWDLELSDFKYQKR